MTTALDRLITKYRSGVGVTPLETCILEQTLKPGELANEAAAELSLIMGAMETQGELLGMYRKERNGTPRHVCDGDQEICRTVCSEEASKRLALKRKADDQVKLWRSFISTLDDQEIDWRASQKSLAVSLLERFDEWVIERKKP